MMGSGIKAKCRNCDKEAPADQFKLHYKYKMMVCPDCFSGKTDKLQKQKEQAIKVDKPKPPGWDAEDVYLEKAAKMKKEDNQAQFSRIPGTGQVQCKCASCKYSFKYNPTKRQPHVCPYCSSDIPKLKTYNLL